MSMIRKTYVDIPEGQIHCRVVAGAEPAIIFLHQTATSSASYAPLLKILASELLNRLVAIDTPGFGGSFDPDGWPSMGEYAQQIIAAVDALGIRQFHIFGHHTGATLAIEIAARAPDRTLSLMLAGPVFMTDNERADFAEGYGEPIALRRDGGHLITNWDYAAMYNPEAPVELLHGEVLAMLRAWRGRPQGYVAVARHDTAAVLRGIDVPVLWLTSPDDFFHAHFDRATALLPNAPIAITGGGNFQPAADAEGVARAITGFLADL